MNPAPVPREIKRNTAGNLEIIWNDGLSFLYPSRELRLACACAHCRDEMTGGKTLNPLTIPADVRPEKIDWVGRYGIRIVWSDTHDTGIYTFEDLRKTGRP